MAGLGLCGGRVLARAGGMDSVPRSTLRCPRMPHGTEPTAWQGRAAGMDFGPARRDKAGWVESSISCGSFWVTAQSRVRLCAPREQEDPPTPCPRKGRDGGVGQGRVGDALPGLPDVASAPHSSSHCSGRDGRAWTPSPSVWTGGGALPTPPVPLCSTAMGNHEKDPSSPKRALSRSNSTVSSKHSSIQQVGGLQAWEGLSGIPLVRTAWPGGAVGPWGASPHCRKGDAEVLHPLGVPSAPARG